MDYSEKSIKRETGSLRIAVRSGNKIRGERHPQAPAGVSLLYISFAIVKKVVAKVNKSCYYELARNRIAFDAGNVLPGSGLC